MLILWENIARSKSSAVDQESSLGKVEAGLWRNVCNVVFIRHGQGMLGILRGAGFQQWLQV